MTKPPKHVPDSLTWDKHQAKPFFNVTSDDGLKPYRRLPFASNPTGGKWLWNIAVCEEWDRLKRPDPKTFEMPADSKGKVSPPDDREDILTLIERMKNEVAGTGWHEYVDRDFEPEKVVGERKRIIDHLTKVQRAKFL